MYHKHGNEFYKTHLRIAKQAKYKLVTAAKCNYYRQKIETCRKDSAKLYGLLNGLLGKSNGGNPLPIRSNELQLANELSKYFLLKVKSIIDIFVNFSPSKSQLIPFFPVLPLMNFAEMNQQEIFCILRTLNKTNCANDPFHIRKMSSKIISDPTTTIFADIVNSSFSTAVFPDSEKYVVVKPLLKTGKDRDELSSYRPLYNTSVLPKVLETAC